VSGSRPWLIGLALLVAVSALVVLRTSDDPVRRPLPLPLAVTSVADGTVGGLVPDVTLRGRVRTSPSRDLRPGVLMLVAPSCDCVNALRQVVAEASRARLVTYVIEAGDSLRQAETLAAQAGGDVGPYADPAGTLAAAYRLRSPAALVLVRRDGVVTQVVPAVGPSLRLATALRALVS
jgi:hypothetical protein